MTDHPIKQPTDVTDCGDGTWMVWLAGRPYRRCKAGILRGAEQVARDLATELERQRTRQGTHWYGCGRVHPECGAVDLARIREAITPRGEAT